MHAAPPPEPATQALRPPSPRGQLLWSRVRRLRRPGPALFEACPLTRHQGLQLGLLALRIV